MISKHGRARTRALVTLAGAGAIAGLAGPATAGAAVTPGRNIEATLGSNMVILSGYRNEQVTLEILRNGVVVGTARHAHNDGATITVNHIGGNDCFDGPATPDLLPGDTVRVTDKDGVVDTEILRDVAIDLPVTADTDPITGELTGTITVRGSARGTADAPIGPADLLEIRLNRASGDWSSTGRKDLRGDARQLTPGSTYDAATGAFTHVFDVGVRDAQAWRDTPGEATVMWSVGETGSISVTADEVVEAPGCPPLATTAMTAVRPGVLNLANTGSGLTVEGAAGPATEVDDVRVSVAGGPAHAATFSDAANGLRTWTVTIPAAEVDALAEGDVPVTATFGGAAPPAPQTRTIRKDRVAPAAPSAIPGAGTYTGAQAVVLNPPPGTTVYFTNDGSNPTTASTRYTGPISVTASQTIKAVAVDAAGNPGPVQTLAYTISAPAPRGGAPTGGTPPIVQQVPVAGAAAAAATTTGAATTTATAGRAILGVRASALAVRNLTLARRVALRTLRARGLRVSMGVPTGANVVRVAVHRARNGRKAGPALFIGYRTPAAAGRFRTTLRDRGLLRKLKAGLYVVEVRPGERRSALGATAARLFRVTR